MYFTGEGSLLQQIYLISAVMTLDARIFHFN